MNHHDPRLLKREQMASLVSPSTRYKDSFIAAVREYHTEGRYDELDTAWLQDHFDTYVVDLLERKVYTAPGKVKESVLWLVEGENFVGRLSIRHELNDFLKTFGGHIGYDIRPTERRKGYGMLILRLALPEVRALGLSRAMLTCDSTNLASRKIIEANGGQLQDETLLEGRDVPTLRWWIAL